MVGRPVPRVVTARQPSPLTEGGSRGVFLLGYNRPARTDHATHEGWRYIGLHAEIRALHTFPTHALASSCCRALSPSVPQSQPHGDWAASRSDSIKSLICPADISTVWVIRTSVSPAP